MPEYDDWNNKIIEEFRANEGRVGGNFEGAPMVLIHHKGRKSGKDYVTPMMFLPDDDSETIYVFASKAGAPAHPDWYYNLTDSGQVSIEVGTQTSKVAVREITGEARDAIYVEQVSRYPGFGEYEVKTAGIRTIPVLALDRAS